MTDARSPKTISGLVGWYTGLSAVVDGSGSVTTWEDISGQGNHATTIQGTPKVGSTGVTSPTPGEHVLAFHYGNFDDHYGDVTRATAAQNGRIYADTLSSEIPPEFGSLVSASTASGQTTYTWFPPSSVSADVLVVGGGGGGGSWNGGAGGGGGGVVYNNSTLVTSGSQTIVVGGGGATNTNGSDSKFGTSLTAYGGGYGQTQGQAGVGGNGGSGGGGSGAGGSGTVGNVGGTATKGLPLSSASGNNGGSGWNENYKDGGGGGGGAGAAGGNGATNLGGNGGDGQSVFGTLYAGGGGGGSFNGIHSTGGSGGGGAGGRGGYSAAEYVNGTPGTPHTGGGGGAGGVGGSGGSGIVIARIRVIEGRGQTQFPFLYGRTVPGGNVDGLRFPTTVMNVDSPYYTLFHVARYYNPTGEPTRRRIFDGLGNNWLSGFHQAAIGGAYHAGSNWITPQPVDLHGNQWVLSTDQRNMYRSNGTDRTTATYTDTKSTQLTINYGQQVGGESSDWAVAEVIVYNRELTPTEYLSVEAYLSAKYFDYGRTPESGVISGSLLNAIYYSGTEGVGGATGYPISIGRIGQQIGNTYQTLLNVSDFRLPLSSGLIRRRYSHTATVHPTTETTLTNLFNGATRTAEPPEVVSDINTRAADAADSYGMIWIGYIYIGTTGTYTFGTNSDDASDMHINYTRVTHAYGGHGVAADLVPFGAEQYTAYLKQGYYRFSYRFEEINGLDGYQALWKTPGATAWAVIPSSVFFHDSRDQTTSSEPTDPTVPFP
jgi:hypothetical protein